VKAQKKPSKGDNPVALSKEEIAFVRAMVIHEDNHILALNKPAGLSSQGGRGQVHTLDEMLWAFARPKHGRPRLIHRLDRDTSGVILTAKTKAAAAYLGKAMMARRGFEKTYLALVAPTPPEPPEGTLDFPLRRVEIGREAYIQVCSATAEGAQDALTQYRTAAVGQGAALVELTPETGRMHQLRVHLAHIGRPILGDPRYGGGLSVAGGPVPRLMLHAVALTFPHPEGRTVRIEAHPPDDFIAVAARVGIVPPG
jgi:tRNA pseudouridine32 synthase/23S rRNA pseudouridine746 synthase